MRELIGLKKGKLLILVLMWSVTLTLFVMTAGGARQTDEPVGDAMTGGETGYQSAESMETESGTPSVRVNGCVSESELAALYTEALDGVISDVHVSIDAGSITLRGNLVADEQEMLEKFPALEDYKLIIKLADGAPVEAEIKMNWEPETGFAMSFGRMTVYDVEVPTEDLSDGAQKLQKKLNERGVKVSPFEVSRWELLPGGLYYSAVLPDADSVKLLYPTI